MYEFMRGMRYAGVHKHFRCLRRAMSDEAKRIEITLETLFESVNQAEDISLRIAENAGFDEDDCHKICMSVREAVINALRYGNQECRDKKVQLIFEVGSEKFVIHVLDQGCGFNLSDIPDPLAEENLLKTSGRGIFLMRTFMDEFGVQRSSEGGAELIMTKWFPWSPRRASVNGSH
jgi:serine/threonine-protein kinase RsbW